MAGPDLFSLAGKTALVTGARRGLGREAARALAEAGADIVGLGPNPMPETQAVVEGTGRRFVWVDVDLGRTSPADLVATVDAGWADWGGLDILVNNAGIIRRAPALEADPADWDAVRTVNLDAVFHLTQAVARRMVADGRRGRIVNIASVLGFQGGVLVPAYAASKHAVIGLTKALANELAPHGITVNAVAPGYMATDNTEALREDPDRSAQILARIPMGDWGPPTALDTTLLYLAADASAYVTGSVVTVDGGWMAR